MVDYNDFIDDLFNDDLPEDHDFNEKFDLKGFEEYLDEKYEEEGIDKVTRFQKMFDDFFPEGREPVGGRLIESKSVTKNKESYTEETWEFGDVTVTRILIDVAKEESVREEEDKNHYVNYLHSTSEDIKEELKKAVSEEDYERAAELKSRLKQIDTFISHNKNKK